MGISPGNMKPMLLATLVIDGARFDPSQLSFNDNFEGEFIQVPLDQLRRWSEHPEMSADGATCLQLVLRDLKFLTTF
jgi:hypothetical protein